MKALKTMIVIAALGIAFVSRATTKLLEGDAEMVTDEWANYIVSNVPDLTEIAQGDLDPMAVVARNDARCTDRNKAAATASRWPTTKPCRPEGRRYTSCSSLHTPLVTAFFSSAICPA